MNYDDFKKKLGIKSIPNQTPIVKVVEEEKLVEPAKQNTSSPIKLDQFKAQTQTSIKVDEEKKVVKPSKSGSPASSPSQAASLPLGWTEHTDPASGNTYYHNASIRISQWEFPNASSVSAHKPKTSVKLLLGISFICFIFVLLISFIKYKSDLIKEEKYVANSTRINDSISLAISVAAEKYLKLLDKKNLNVSKYRNGDVIPQVQDQNAWANLTTGAWCYYDNDATNGTKYGKLYNWYAVNDPRGLAPNGFHIPSDAEWTVLTDYLGGSAAAGTKMKSSFGWDENGNGTGGCRNYGGTFSGVGRDGYWWSATEHPGNSWDAFYLCLTYDNGYVKRRGGYKQGAFSVRCLGDFDLTAAAARVADSVAAVAARVEDSLTRISASEEAAARIEDSIRDLKQAAIQLENERKLRIEAEKYLNLDKKNLNVSKYRNGDAGGGGYYDCGGGIFLVDYESQADVKVFVVKYESQADLKVYKVKYGNQAVVSDGKWCFTKYENQSQKKIYFVQYENQADLKIYFVEYENQAGWKNNSKKSLLY